jgi:hypothetical protein
MTSSHRNINRRPSHRSRFARQQHQSNRSGTRRLLFSALGGAAGTTAMDILLFHRYQRSGGTQGPLEWEFSSGVEKWTDVSAPGLVGKRLLEGFLGHEVPDRWARSVQNLTHWATGIGWSTQFGLLTGATRRSSWAWGLVLGPSVWLAGYVVLPAAKIYKPLWEYDATTLVKDLSAHLVYGVTTGAIVAAFANALPGE